MTIHPLFPSPFIAGFECSTHRTRAGHRLDMVARTGHDVHLHADYRRLEAFGIRTAREGLRWHLIEPAPGRYDFASVRPFVHAARDAGLLVIWDVLHYGWPDDLDLFAPAFISRFARFAAAFARHHRDETDAPLWIAPVNEISFLTWCAGDIAVFHPFATGRADELKRQLVRAAIAAVEAVWAVDPRARVAQIDPAFHVVARAPGDEPATERFRLCQFEAWDMLAGRLAPELGGHPRYLDVLGLNYYATNQWVFDPSGQHPHETIPFEDPRYRPLRDILGDYHTRYRRPLFVAETGAEGDRRAPWLRYVGAEVRSALRAGVPVEGLCLYPIVDFPGWENDRDCRNGLWGYADDSGHRPLDEPYAAELRHQTARFEHLRRDLAHQRPAAIIA